MSDTAPNPTLPTPTEMAARSIMRESADTTRLYAALVKALGAIHAPERKDWRTVQVRSEKGAYSFAYAEHGTIMEIVRPILLENGLGLLQPIVTTLRGPALLTKLIHESGQWMETEIPLPPLGNNPQAFGSIVTYVRRYAISSMLNVAGEGDDDGNIAAGNHMQDAPRQTARAPATNAQRPAAGPAQANGRDTSGGSGNADPPRDTNEVIGEAVARVLINRARLAEGVAEGHALLDDWTQRMGVLEQLRGTPSWEPLEREMGAGLKRSLGTEPAAAFVAALRATEPAQVTQLQEAWDGRWAETLGAMQQEAPATYALLRRAVAAQIQRVRAAHPGKEAPEAEQQPTSYVLTDLIGGEEPFTDAVAFARAYVRAWEGIDPQHRADLARKNVRPLGQAARHAEARKILDAAAAAQQKAPAK